MGIHDYQINVGLPRIEEKIRNAGYLEANRTSILEFENFLFADGLGTLGILKSLTVLNIIAKTANKDFREMGKLDVQAIVAGIERSGRAETTKIQYKIVLRKFFRWLQGEDNAASWIKTTIRRSARKLPENLLTESEIKAMIEAADHPRDKALIAVLYDSGCRIGEIGGLQVKNINFDQYGAILSVHGKTGSRRVRIVFSVSYLASWLDVHPQKGKSEAFVFVKINGTGRDEQMRHNALLKIITKTAKKAGIEKRIHPHLFRHSRSTELAQHLTEAQMEEHLGWVHGSNMPSVYVHLSGKQVDDAMLRIYGKKKKEDTLPELTSRTCPRCEKDNGPTSKFCARCGLPLDPQIQQEIIGYDKILSKVIEYAMADENAREMWGIGGKQKE